MPTFPPLALHSCALLMHSLRRRTIYHRVGWLVSSVSILARAFSTRLFLRPVGAERVHRAPDAEPCIRQRTDLGGFLFSRDFAHLRVYVYSCFSHRLAANSDKANAGGPCFSGKGRSRLQRVYRRCRSEIFRRPRCVCCQARRRIRWSRWHSA